MPAPRITWQDLQQAPDDGKRREAIGGELYQRQGVRQYWVVDPRDDAVEVWRFQEEPSHARSAGTLPVRLGSETVGEIDLDAVFARGG